MRTRAGGGAVVFLIALGVAAAVALGLALRALLDVVPLWGFVALGALEIAAAGSAVLDWRDAKLEIATKRRALLVGHVTLVRRLSRRARWHTTTLRLLVPTSGQRAVALPATGVSPATERLDERAAA